MPVLNPSVDGRIASIVSPTFAGARDATSGTFNASTSRYSDAIKYSKATGFRGNSISINRYFIEFDTSGISVTPADAELSLRGFSQNSADFFVVKANFSDGSIANADFDSIVGWTAGADNSSNVTKYSSEVETWSTSAFNDIALNSTALSDIASVDNFKICLIQAENDLNNVETTGTAKTGFFRTGFLIHIDYTEGTAGYSHKVLGVAAGSIGKINGVATANVGKVIGVD